MSLPADPSADGNVWCDACRQSLCASKTKVHLASKKHLERSGAASPASASAAPASAAPASPASASAAPASPAPASAAPAKKRAPNLKGLPADPGKNGNFWCGICQVSLTPKLAEEHIETKRHVESAARHLAEALATKKAPGK